jgi:hypothetical protein
MPRPAAKYSNADRTGSSSAGLVALVLVAVESRRGGPFGEHKTLYASGDD